MKNTFCGFNRKVPTGEASEAVPHLWKSNKVEMKY